MKLNCWGKPDKARDPVEQFLYRSLMDGWANYRDEDHSECNLEQRSSHCKADLTSSLPAQIHQALILYSILND